MTDESIRPPIEHITPSVAHIVPSCFRASITANTVLMGGLAKEINCAVLESISVLGTCQAFKPNYNSWNDRVGEHDGVAKLDKLAEAVSPEDSETLPFLWIQLLAS